MGDGGGRGADDRTGGLSTEPAAVHPTTSSTSPSGDALGGSSVATELSRRIGLLDLDPSGRPAASVVATAAAAFRLEGWALWCQLSAIAALLRRWRAEPPCPEPNPTLGAHDGGADGGDTGADGGDAGADGGDAGADG